eukprot:3807464-Rhodomonas_salina.2
MEFVWESGQALPASTLKVPPRLTVETAKAFRGELVWRCVQHCAPVSCLTTLDVFGRVGAMYPGRVGRDKLVGSVGGQL